MFETSSSAIFADAAHDTARMRSGTARGGTRTLNSGEAVVTQQLAQKCLELMDRLQVRRADPQPGRRLGGSERTVGTGLCSKAMADMLPVWPGGGGRAA